MIVLYIKNIFFDKYFSIILQKNLGAIAHNVEATRRLGGHKRACASKTARPNVPE